jgi:hypothetical protein
MASGREHLERAIDFCDRALAQLRVLDQPLGENPEHEVITLVEAVRTELVATLKEHRLALSDAGLGERRPPPKPRQIFTSRSEKNPTQKAGLRREEPASH